MRTGTWSRLALAALAAVVFSGVPAVAQSSTTEEGKRKVKTKTAPLYPDLARRMRGTGKVKIEVVIAPDGHVKSTRVVGGHLLLVKPCVDALKEWKFVSATEETTQMVEFDFHTGN